MAVEQLYVLPRQVVRTFVAVKTLHFFGFGVVSPFRLHRRFASPFVVRRW